MGGTPPLSGVVICFDERENIARCLESLAFCDEIVVVDSGSTDGTREIARRYTKRVVEQEFLGYVKQKNFALDLAAHDWVVSLDADEALSPELAEEIRDALAGDGGEFAGYRLDRVTRFLGVWHDRGAWYPDWQLRVFRRSRGRWEGRDPHDRFRLDGPVRRLGGRLEHFSYRDLADSVETLDRYSTIAAREMRAAGVRFRLVDLLVRPVWRFLRGYLLRGGFLKGLPGLAVAANSAYYAFLKYAKLWEAERPD